MASLTEVLAPYLMWEIEVFLYLFNIYLINIDYLKHINKLKVVCVSSYTVYAHGC